MGTVLNTDPLLVLTDASDTPVPALSLGSYSPVMSDRVAVERHGRRLLVLGKPGPPALEVASGSVTITIAAVNTPTSVSISFPAGRFSAPPDVVVGMLSLNPGTQYLGASVSGVTATGATVWATRSNVGAATVVWQAINVPADG
jgi:hypothetical protein